jgi:hypothetical protein
MIVTLGPIKIAVDVSFSAIFRIEGSKSDSPLLGFKEIDSGPLLLCKQSNRLRIVGSNAAPYHFGNRRVEPINVSSVDQEWLS